MWAWLSSWWSWIYPKPQIVVVDPQIAFSPVTEWLVYVDPAQVEAARKTLATLGQTYEVNLSKSIVFRVSCLGVELYQLLQDSPSWLRTVGPESTVEAQK